MKRLLTILTLVVLLICNGCSNSNLLSKRLTTTDYVNGIKEALSIGARFGGQSLGKGTFDRETLLNIILPKDLQRVTSVLSTLGLSSEVDKFSNTLTKAAEETVEKSVPIFLNGIGKINIKNAAKIVANGGTSATDYLRSSIGDSLRNTIAPVMNTALNNYGVNAQFKKLLQPVQMLLGDKLNLDLGNLMAGFIANAMFKKIEEKERDIRANAAARTSSLLQRVFGG